MPLADLPAYRRARAGVYREFNAIYFQLSPTALAQMLVGELERVGAVRRDDGWLRPC